MVVILSGCLQIRKYIRYYKLENMFNLIKKILLGILGFIVGFALYSGNFLRELIQYIFKWSTSDRIVFYGKNIYFFSNKIYYISIGLVLLVLILENLNKKTPQILKNVIVCIHIFGILLIGISAIDANIKITECTACDDGIRKLHWNDINYSLIIGMSAIISIIPSLIRIIMKNINNK